MENGKPTCCDLNGEPVLSSVCPAVWVHPATSAGRIVCAVKSPEVAERVRRRRIEGQTKPSDRPSWAIDG